MAINFNEDSVFNLKPIDPSSVRREVDALMIDGESVLMAFQTVRDQLVFTNMRIISIDVQGVTGKRKSFTSMPYKNVQYFTIQTVGFMELFPDSELFLVFNNNMQARFEFKGRVDVGLLGRILSTYIL